MPHIVLLHKLLVVDLCLPKSVVKQISSDYEAMCWQRVQQCCWDAADEDGEGGVALTRRPLLCHTSACPSQVTMKRRTSLK